MYKAYDHRKQTVVNNASIYSNAMVLFIKRIIAEIYISIS